MYVIKNSNGLFVSLAGRANTFTNRIKYARKFANEESARYECCGNENPVYIGCGIKWIT